MDTVKVAVRIRPLVSSELENGCRSCIERFPNIPQISIGKNAQMFTFNYVFDEFEGQNKLYNTSVKDLIENLFKGYNVTILAYGQTGSGKTYTMGTNNAPGDELGVIPRAIYDIFDTVNSKSDFRFNITCSFIELYNESLYDLLTKKEREQSVVDMREYNNGVYLPGLTEVPVRSADEAFNQLRQGSLGRVTGATYMNAQSSRSHAVFTINMKIIHKENPKEVMSSKFHLVDLAGSERSKKTGATGDRFKEGVNINKGLMVLGNVISQLGDGQAFINYRDSKLTRLLQDSLGGNSVTLMIACISPADYNQDESLSTLRYADRAKKIKNKPVVNQDPQSAEISRLRKENEELRLKIIEGGAAEFSCPAEHQDLESKLVNAEASLKELSQLLAESVMQNAAVLERSMIVEKIDESLKEKLRELSTMSEGILSHDEESDKVKELKSKIQEVQAHRVQSDQELFSHSKSADIVHQSNFLVHEQILSQAKINKEILAISKNLIWKEELMAKLTENIGPLGDLQETSEENLKELHKQIALLQTEKEELNKQLSAIPKTTANVQKVSEERRKRLQELEAQKATLMKKVAEQEKVIKMRETSRLKITTLQKEINDMKQLKIKLIHKMKAENDKFRHWKAKTDKEVMTLKNQNLKKQFQMKKMEQEHQLQQNVLKRKLEQAAAANKRIMAVLDRQKQAKLKRLKGSASEKIKDRVNEELEVLESEYLAQKSLDSLIHDRAVLSKELAVVNESLLRTDISSDEKCKLVLDKKQIEDDLALRSAEISDLQQKILDIRQEAKESWEIIATMADAKFALTYMFEVLGDKTKDLLNLSHTTAELKDNNLDYELQIQDLKQKLEASEQESKAQIQLVEYEYEQKVYILLKRIQEQQDPAQLQSLSTECYKIQVEELEKTAELKQKLKEAEEEISHLKNILDLRKPVESFQDAFNNFVEHCKDSPLNSTFTKNSNTSGTYKRKAKDFTFRLADEESLKALDTSGEIDNDNPNEDPDWTKTPLYKCLASLKPGPKRVKPPYQGKCNCAGKCVRRICHCNKSDKKCNENCSCGEKCTNQPSQSDDSKDCSPLKKPRFDEDQ